MKLTLIIGTLLMLAGSAYKTWQDSRPVRIVAHPVSVPFLLLAPPRGLLPYPGEERLNWKQEFAEAARTPWKGPISYHLPQNCPYMESYSYAVAQRRWGRVECLQCGATEPNTYNCSNDW
ncbi:MAG: hypothetical protein QM758_05875 [Armatimonas sp.]